MKNKEKFVLIYCLLVIILFLSLSFPLSSINFSPDNNALNIFSDTFVKNNSLYYRENLNKEYNTTIFHPRNAAYSPLTEKVVPNSFLGIFLVFSTFKFFLNNLFLLIPLLAILCLLFLYLLIKKLFQPKIAIVAMILLSIFPPFFYYSIRISNNMLSLPFMLGGFYYFILFKLEEKNKYLFISTILFSSSIWARYIDVIPILIFVLIYFPYNRINDSNFIRLLIANTILMILLLLPLLLINNDLYGNPLKTGYHLNPYISSNEDDLLVISKLPETNVFYSITNNIHRFFFTKLAAWYIIGLAGIYYLYKKSATIQKRIIFYVFFTAIFYLIYIGSSIFYGYSNYKIFLNASYIRYYLPFSIFIVVPLSFYLLHNKNKLISYFLICIFIFSTTTAIFLGEEAYEKDFETASRYIKIRSEILNGTEHNAIIFTTYWDKLLGQNRKVAIYNSLPLQIRDQEIIRIISALKNDEYPVYLLKEEDSFYYRKLLINNGFILECKNIICGIQ